MCIFWINQGYFYCTQPCARTTECDYIKQQCIYLQWKSIYYSYAQSHHVNSQLLYIFYEVGNICELVGINTRPEMIASINELNQSNVTMM